VTLIATFRQLAEAVTAIDRVVDAALPPQTDLDPLLHDVVALSLQVSRDRPLRAAVDLHLPVHPGLPRVDHAELPHRVALNRHLYGELVHHRRATLDHLQPAVRGALLGLGLLEDGPVTVMQRETGLIHAVEIECHTGIVPDLLPPRRS
jgi:hypothetical protein